MISIDPSNTLLGYLEQALRRPYGIALALGSGASAKRLRRAFYSERDRARAKGNNCFDSLSFQIRPTGELWVIRRDKLPLQKKRIRAETRDLERHELPLRILARGPHRLGLLDISSLSRILRDLDENRSQAGY